MNEIIQPLDIENNCLGLFVAGKFIFRDIEKHLRKTEMLWGYTPLCEEDTNYYFVNILLKGESLVNFAPNRQEMQQAQELLIAHQRALETAKIELSELCFFEAIPRHLLEKWFGLREQAIKGILNSRKKPEDYDILHKIYVLTESINRRHLIVSGKRKKIEYDIFSSSTGRLTTTRESFPILNIKKEKRKNITPQNDLFLEFDLNGAEIRTLLAFSGVEQPKEDIHTWNMKSLPPWVTREQAKEDFFAWLYNPKSTNEQYEKFYNKNIFSNHYQQECIVTPFSRRLKVDRRKALNYLLQSTTSDIVLSSAYNIMKFLKNRKSFVAFTMHDSVVLDYSKDEHALVGQLKDIFEKNIFGKFKSNVMIGKDYGSMKRVEI